MNSSQELHIQALFDRLEEKHYQMMSDVEAAKRECILSKLTNCTSPVGLQSLLLEKPLLVSRVNRSLAGYADITNADFVRIPNGGTRLFIAASHQQNSQEMATRKNFEIIASFKVSEMV